MYFPCPFFTDLMMKTHKLQRFSDYTVLRIYKWQLKTATMKHHELKARGSKKLQKIRNRTSQFRNPLHSLPYRFVNYILYPRANV